MRAFVRGLGKLNEVIGRVFCSGAWIFLAIMTVVVVASVLFRYVLNSSLTWAEDVSLMMMIWMAFLVAPTAYRHGANVALDTFKAMLHGRIGHFATLVINIVLVVLFIYFIDETLALMERSRIRANTVPVPMKYIYSIMPAAFGALVLVGIEHVARSLIGLFSPAAPEAQPPGPVFDDRATQG